MQRQKRVAVSRNLQHGQVGQQVGADQFGYDLSPIIVGYGDLDSALYHVIVGQHQARLIEDHAGPAAEPGRLPAEAVPGDDPDHDGNHRGPYPLHRVGDVGQLQHRDVPAFVSGGRLGHRW